MVRNNNVFIWNRVINPSFVIYTIMLLFSLSDFCYGSSSNESHTTEITSLSTKFKDHRGRSFKRYPPYVIRSSKKQTGTIIFLHGVGDTGEWWARALVEIRQPYMKILCPTATSLPVTWNDGLKMTAWYDFNGHLDEYRRKEDVEDFNKSTIYLHGLIDEELRRGVPPNRIVIGGFSQGGAMAIHAGLTYPKPLGGIISYSAWIPMAKTFNQTFNPANKDVPILKGHGDDDEIIPYHYGNVSATELKRYCTNVIFKAYEDVNHKISDEGMADIKHFLDEHFPRIDLNRTISPRTTTVKIIK